MAARLGYFNEWLGEAAFSSANLKRESPDRENRLPGRGLPLLFLGKRGYTIGRIRIGGGDRYGEQATANRLRGNGGGERPAVR